MKITCPHCSAVFEGRLQIVKPAKTHYRWYEFTSNHTFCPECQQRYRADVSAKGLLVICVIMALFFIGTYFDYVVVVLLAVLLAVFVVNQYPEKFIKVKSEKVT